MIGSWPDTRLCSVPGCTRKRFSRGFCAAHYQRWRRFGDVNAAHPVGHLPRMPEADLSRDEVRTLRAELDAIIEPLVVPMLALITMLGLHGRDAVDAALADARGEIGRGDGSTG